MQALKNILIEKHYAHKAPSGKTHYFKYEDAVIAISIPANNNVSKWLVGEKNRVWELSRMWAPDGHRKHLLTEAIAHALREFRLLEPEVWAVISYADPNGHEQSGQRAHEGGVYLASSWTYLGQCEDGRYFRCAKTGQVHARRSFHMGHGFIRDHEIVARGFKKFNLPGKHRFARGLNKKARKLIAAKAKEIGAVHPITLQRAAESADQKAARRAAYKVVRKMARKVPHKVQQVNQQV